jgi:hypothetical protein
MRHDGYYLGTPYEDYVAGNNKRTEIIHWAYTFLENDIVKLNSKDDSLYLFLIKIKNGK